MTLIEQISVRASQPLFSPFVGPSISSLIASGGAVRLPNLASGVVLPNLAAIQAAAQAAAAQRISDPPLTPSERAGTTDTSGGREISTARSGPISVPDAPPPARPTISTATATAAAAAVAAAAGAVSTSPAGAPQTTQGGVTSEVPVSSSRSQTTTTVRTGGPVPFGQFLEAATGALRTLSDAGVVRGSIGDAFRTPSLQFASRQPTGVMSRAEQAVGMNLPGGASCPQLFHVTKCGNVVANRVTFVDGHFFTPITPASWKGRVSVRGPRRRHTHAQLHTHRRRRRSR